MTSPSPHETSAIVFYSCVAKAPSVVLCESLIRPSSANVTSVLRSQMIPKLLATPPIVPLQSSSSEKRNSYSADTYMVHVLTHRSGVVFLCACDKAYANYMAFKYLEKISANFIAFFREDTHRTPQACLSFTRQLKQEADFFNSPDANKLKKIQQDIDQVKSVMLENIDTILERGDKIEGLMEKTTLLLGESTTFSSNATSLRRKMWLKNVKLLAIAVLLVLGVLTIILLIACQGFKQGNRCS